MNFTKIIAMPTCITEMPAGCSGIHESVLRSYHILGKVKDYLRRGVPADVVLELIAEMESHD